MKDLRINRAVGALIALVTLVVGPAWGHGAEGDQSIDYSGVLHLNEWSDQEGELSGGEVLLGELNCVACHGAGKVVKKRLSSKKSPVLGKSGLKLTPQYLRDFLKSPHGVKSGTTMPDMLHGLPRKEQAAKIEALTHFLVSRQSSKSEGKPVHGDRFRIKNGERLYHQVGCVACHGPRAAPSEVRTPAMKRITEASGEAGRWESPAAESVPLGDQWGKKTTVRALSEFLKNPMDARPSGRMPALGLSSEEATSIAMYLLRDQIEEVEESEKQKIRGVRYHYYEDEFGGDVPHFDKLKPKKRGIAEGFDISVRERADHSGVKFTGFIRIEKAGKYTFYSDSDDGSRVYIGGELVVRNDGHHGMTEKQGTIELEAGDHPIKVTYFNAGGGHGLTVSYKGPGIDKQAIPGSVLSTIGRPMKPLDSEPFEVDPGKVKRGKALFVSMRCAACHEIGGIENVKTPQPAPPLKEVDVAEGCLSEEMASEVPDYRLSDSQRTALQEAVAEVDELGQPLEPKDRIRKSMTVMNCYACHQRGGIGGVNDERRPYFQLRGEQSADLGEEGRIPPRLTGVGAKLKPEWMRRVLAEGTKVRPYMATRMPQFGLGNVGHLVKLFQKVDDPDAGQPKPPSFKAIKYGRRLVGSEGMSCIACHRFAGQDSLGIPAMDLAKMTQRLKKEWFRRYLLDPKALRPGTRMPSFWPDGVSVEQEILGGDTDRQIDAIWAYLAQGEEAKLPRGLIQVGQELIPKQGAIIYRNFIEGGGSRAIGVGYPEDVNLAFDANGMRLAMIWHGAFIDASRHWTGRGQGFEPPLGDEVLRLPASPPFAVLKNSSQAWPSQIGGAGGFHQDNYEMQGYRLDEERRPTFMYRFKSIDIEDYPVPLETEPDTGLVRTLTLRARKPVSGLWYRAAVGSEIKAQPDGSFLVNDRLTLQFQLSEMAKPVVRKSEGQMELILPVRFNENGQARIVETLTW